MSVLDILGGGAGGSADEALINHAIKTAYRYRFMDEIGNRVSDSVMPSGAQEREKERDELDIMLKKRALGLPVSTGEYEQLDNKKSTSDRVLSIFKRNAVDQIPTPSYMQRKHVPFAANAAGDTIKGITSHIPKGGTHAAGSGIRDFYDVYRLLSRY